jgi:quinol monooxygenase YgiN
VADITRYHRIQASPGYDDAVRYVVDALAAAGVSSTIHRFTADGRTDTFGWISPPGWTIRGGGLEQIEPNSRILGRFDVIAQSILGQSAPGDLEGDVVHVGAGDTAACFEGLDLDGKFLLSHGRPAAMLRFLQGTGATGLIIYPDIERAAPSHDLVQYGGFFPRAHEIPWLPMGFSISRRAADALLRDMEQGRVRVHGHVDASFLDGHPMQVLEARIGPDDSDVEVLLCAHLCHPAPSANDNASGSGALLEVARVLAAMDRKRDLDHAVRLLWVPEFNGVIPWIAANVADLRRVLFTINLDMVGESPEIIGEPLRVFRVPNAHPTFVNACIEPLLEMIAEDPRFRAVQGSQRVLHWIFDAPTGGSDHLAFEAPPASLPSLMLGHDDPFWHTDLDTVDKVDPTRLKHVGTLTALLATLPSWAADEAARLAEWLLVHSQRELAESSRLARDGGADLIEIAALIERERAASLRKLLGDDAWDSGTHRAALDATCAALRDRSAQAPIQEAIAGALKHPTRAVDGPVRYELLQELADEDRTFLEQKLFSNHGAPPHMLANLATGTRTVQEMAARLTLDFRRTFAVEDIVRATELLAQVGYLQLDDVADA